MASRSYAFTVSGIEPTSDPAWQFAPESVRRDFWRAVVRYVLRIKARELEQGLDRFGRPMVPISAATRAKGRHRSYTGQGSADGPPLTPAGALSRTRDLLTGRAYAHQAEFFWTFDPVSGQHWGKVLGYHRDGAGRLPVRDVIGLSPLALQWVKQQMDRWWADWKAANAVATLGGQVSVRVPAGTARPKPPPRQPARFDIENSVGSIGGAGDEHLKQAIAEGKHTGFRFGGDSKGYAGTAMTPPKPRPKPPGRAAAAPAPLPQVAAAGVKFTPAYQARGTTTTVVVDLAKLDAALAKDKGFHVGPGGTGPSAKPGAYAGFRAFLAKAKAKGIAVEQPRLAFDAQGNPTVIDGRHRIAVLRDMGVKSIPVSVPRAELKAFLARFGVR